MLARFNQLDLLEISINGADVSELLSLASRIGCTYRYCHIKLPLQTVCFKIIYYE